MAKHGKGRSAHRNPPEGGYAKSIGMLAVGSVVAGAAGYGMSLLVGLLKQKEMFRDLILALSGLVVGGAVGLAGTPSRTRQLLGSAVSFGTVSVASARYIAYLRATPEQRAIIDAADTADTAPSGYAYATIPGGAPVASNSYLGLGAGMPAAGAPVASNAYHGWGAY